LLNSEQIRNRPSKITNQILPLSLLKAGILFVDHIQPSFPSHDLAIHTSFLN